MRPGMRSAFPAIILLLVLSQAVGASAPAADPAEAGPDLGAGFRPGDLLSRSLQGPMAGAEEIVFAVRGLGGDGHWYANFGYWVSNAKQMMYGPPGGYLAKLNLRTGRVTVLLADSQGGVRDPCVDYDAKKVLFSYRRGDSIYYHLYEIGVDGSGLRQLTDGPQDDIEPIYLPGGDLVFGSSRCNRWVNCWFTQVAILYRSDKDGRNVRQISSNIEQDNTPWMLPDGRLLYMRWEYVDRSRVQYHHLWTLNPDGTAQMVYFGNMHAGIVMLDAKPIPGTDKVVASFSPGHGQREHAGSITVVAPDNGPDDRGSARRITKDEQWRDPWAFSESCFIAARDRTLCVVDGQGNAEPFYVLPDSLRPLDVHEPRPVVPRRREPVIPSHVNWSRPTGHLILADVTHGRNMKGVRPGEVTKLLVLESLPKPVNFSGDMEPISLGGTFTLPRILGTVPVEPDGSAYIEVPAMRPLFFVALDRNDLSVKRMQSFVSVMPGETASCAGCHENRTDTVRPKPRLAALERPPSRIEPIADAPGVFDFPRDIQPILDKHCTSCHDYGKSAPKTILAGDRGPWYSQAYATLMTRGQVSHGRDAAGNTPPRKIGSSASPLMRLLDGSHYDAKPSPHEVKMVRLWIESGAPFGGTYAALGTGMVGAATDADVATRRCAECHGKSDPKQGTRVEFKTYRDLLFNLTRPEQSLVLLAPLAGEAGGLGLCNAKPHLAPGERTGGAVALGGRTGGAVSSAKREAAAPPAEKLPPPFADATDPDYRKLLSQIVKASQQLEKVRRFDMPGFRPNEHYVREMKRFGILPSDLGPADPVDPYATDEKYWRSFWYTPPFVARAE